jgi:hypothetical protein
MTPITSAPSAPLFKNGSEEIVEISLLLPTNRAEALVALSIRRQQSVAQILRQLIDRALAGEELAHAASTP